MADDSNIESVTISTPGGASVTMGWDEFQDAARKMTGGRVTKQMEEQKLLEVEPEPAEYEFAITGATGFEGGKDLHIGELVTLSVGGVVAGVSLVTKTRKADDDSGEPEEYLVRVVKIKATGAIIR